MQYFQEEEGDDLSEEDEEEDKYDSSEGMRNSGAQAKSTGAMLVGSGSGSST